VHLGAYFVAPGNGPTVRKVQLRPRYQSDPVIRIEMDVADPAVPVLRQRRRLGSILAGLDDDQWAVASRCSDWSVRDVIAHLADTNGFWAISAGAALGGEPTRFLEGFDPVATPAQLVDGQRQADTAAVLARYEESVDAMAAVLTGLGTDEWGTLAEAPPGHVELRAVAAHALWDAWIHERDVLLPLGIDPVQEPDEVGLSLRYAASLGPAFNIVMGGGRRGALQVDAVEPDLRFLVEVGDGIVVRDGGSHPGEGVPSLQGRAVDLVEGLSFRAELQHDLADDDRWLLAGLDQVFDRS
jgi:uncharacterized protein (TIGR03083 family)